MREREGERACLAVLGDKRESLKLLAIFKMCALIIVSVEF